MSWRLTDDVNPWITGEWNHTLFVWLTRRMLKKAVQQGRNR
jgi:hypothetical protein